LYQTGVFQKKPLFKVIVTRTSNSVLFINGLLINCLFQHQQPSSMVQDLPPQILESNDFFLFLFSLSPKNRNSNNKSQFLEHIPIGLIQFKFSQNISTVSVLILDSFHYIFVQNIYTPTFLTAYNTCSLPVWVLCWIY